MLGMSWKEIEGHRRGHHLHVESCHALGERLNNSKDGGAPRWRFAGGPAVRRRVVIKKKR